MFTKRRLTVFLSDTLLISPSAWPFVWHFYYSLIFPSQNVLYAILGRSADPNKVYIEEIMPVKLAHCQHYVAERSL